MSRLAAKTRRKATITFAHRGLKESKGQVKAAAPEPFPRSPAVVSWVEMPVNIALYAPIQHRLGRTTIAKASVWRTPTVPLSPRSLICMATFAQTGTSGLRGIVPGVVSLRLLSLTRLEICWGRCRRMNIVGVNPRSRIGAWAKIVGNTPCVKMQPTPTAACAMQAT